MKMKLLCNNCLAIILVLGLSSTASAQDCFQLRVNAGITDLESTYYLSLNADYALTPWLAISPAFSQISNLSSSKIYVSNSSGGMSVGRLKKDELEVGKNYYENDWRVTSFGLDVYLKPFRFFNNKKLKKHDLFVGAGYAFRSYTITYTKYSYNGNAVDLKFYHNKRLANFSPTYAILGYQYSLTKNFALGASSQLIGIDGEEGILMAGIIAGFTF